MKADVYRNLHKKCMSVRSREKDSYGRVKRRTKDLVMQNCSFVVREKGRRKVILEKRKNVHAFIRGNVSSTYVHPDFSLDGLVEVTYNPYHSDSFYVKHTGQPVNYSGAVIVKENKVYALNPTLIVYK